MSYGADFFRKYTDIITEAEKVEEDVREKEVGAKEKSSTGGTIEKTKDGVKHTAKKYGGEENDKAKEEVDEGFMDAAKGAIAKVGSKLNTAAGTALQKVGIDPASVGAKVAGGVAQVKSAKAAITNNPQDRAAAQAANLKAADARTFASGQGDPRVAKYRGNAISYDYMKEGTAQFFRAYSDMITEAEKSEPSSTGGTITHKKGEHGEDITVHKAGKKYGGDKNDDAKDKDED